MTSPFFASALVALAFAASATAATPESVVAESAPPSPAASETAVDSEAPSSRKASRSAMTLDEITIEGDIDVPQVLFITARDHLRVARPQHAIYWADAVATVLARPAIGPVRPPVGDSSTQTPAPQREN